MKSWKADLAQQRDETESILSISEVEESENIDDNGRRISYKRQKTSKLSPVSSKSSKASVGSFLSAHTLESQNSTIQKNLFHTPSKTPQLSRTAGSRIGSVRPSAKKLVGFRPSVQIEPLKAYLRIRPIGNPEEKSFVIEKTENSISVLAPEESAASKNPDGRLPSTFFFTKVYDEAASQESFFEETVSPLVDSLFNGESSFCFTYGITNAGKTYTVYGPKEDPGIVPRSFELVFQSIAMARSKAEGRQVEPKLFKKALPVKSDYEYTFYMSFSELYQDAVYDLLLDPKIKPKNLNLRDGSDGRTVVEGLTEKEIKNMEEARELLERGQKNRKSAKTLLNSESSRSHAMVNLRLQIADRRSDSVISTSSALCRNGRLCFVDLAGSERANRTQNTDNRLKESSSINTQLMYLARCLEVLRDNQAHPNNQQLPPFRQCKLTRMFQDALSGKEKGKLVMIVNLNPRAADYDESLHLVQYAVRAQKINPGQGMPSAKKPTLCSEKKKRAPEKPLAELEQDAYDESQAWDMVDALKAEIVELHRRYHEAEKELRAEFAAEMARQNEESNQFLQDQMEKQERIHEITLERKLNLVKKQYQEAHAAADQRSDPDSADVAHLHNRIAELQARSLQQAEMTRKELEDNETAKHAQFSNLKRMHEDERAKMLKVTEELQDMNDCTKRSLAEAQGTITALQTRVNDLESNLRSLAAAKEQVEVKHSRDRCQNPGDHDALLDLTHSKKDLEQKLENFKSELNATRKAAQSGERVRSELEAKVAILTSEVETSRKAAEAALHSKSALHAEVESLRSKANDPTLHKTIAELKAQVALLQAEVARRMKAQQAAEEARTKAETQLDISKLKAREEVSKRDEVFQEHQRKLGDHQRMLQQQRDELEDAFKRQREDLKADFQRQLERETSELTTMLLSRAEALRKADVEKLTEKLNILSAELHADKDEKNKALSKVETLQEENLALQKSIAHIKAERSHPLRTATCQDTTESFDGSIASSTASGYRAGLFNEQMEVVKSSLSSSGNNLPLPVYPAVPVAGSRKDRQMRENKDAAATDRPIRVDFSGDTATRVREPRLSVGKRPREQQTPTHHEHEKENEHAKEKEKAHLSSSSTPVVAATSTTLHPSNIYLDLPNNVGAVAKVPAASPSKLPSVAMATNVATPARPAAPASKPDTGDKPRPTQDAHSSSGPHTGSAKKAGSQSLLQKGKNFAKSLLYSNKKPPYSLGADQVPGPIDPVSDAIHEELSESESHSKQPKRGRKLFGEKEQRRIADELAVAPAEPTQATRGTGRTAQTPIAKRTRSRAARH